MNTDNDKSGNESSNTPRNRRWTLEEVEYLKENLGFRKINDISKHLNRTETAITLKAKRLGLGYTHSLAGRITSGELAKLLQVDRNTVKGWIKYHKLPATRRITCKKRKYTLISPTEFWKWAEKNKERLDFSKIERNAIPPEPDWVADERIHPSYKQRTYQEWTTREDKLLAKYIDEGLSYREIGMILNRTDYSVEKRYRRIRLLPYYQGKNAYAIKPGQRLNMEKDTL